MINDKNVKQIDKEGDYVENEIFIMSNKCFLSH